MKESLSLSQPLQQLILEGYEEKPMKYLTQTRRKGTFPLRQGHDHASGISNDQYGGSGGKTYPYSAMGIVRISTQHGVRETVGAVIHPRLIITVMPASVPPSTAFQFIPLSQFLPSQPLLVKKTHPSNLELLRSSDQLNIGEQASEGEASHCIVLEMAGRVDLEEALGSFDISFEDQKLGSSVCDYALLGLQDNGEQQYKICEKPLEVTLSNNHFTYQLNHREKALPGSLVITRGNGKGYEVKGMHLGIRQGRGLALRLAKPRWQQFAKMTYKGGSLQLEDENIGRRGITFLSQLNMKRLSELSLERTGLTGQHVEVICRQKYQLTGLNLNFNSIGDDGIQALSVTKWPLEQLYLTRNPFTWQGMQALSKNKWRNMVHVQLGENVIGNRGIHFLVRCDWTNLKTLCLNKARIDDSGCDHLRKGVWPCLIHLNLDHNKIGLRGALSLANAAWKNLTHINLASNKLGSLGMKQLIRGEWKSMEGIRIQRNESGGERHAMNSVKHLMKEKFRRVHIV